MALSPADHLKFAEQALAVDQQRLTRLTAEREALVANGGDTTQIDSSIANLNSDITGGQEDLIQAQAAVEDQKTAEAGDTAGSALKNADPQAGEALNASEQSNLTAASNESPGDAADAAPDNTGATSSDPVQQPEAQLAKPTTVSATAVPFAGNPDDEARAKEAADNHKKSKVGANKQVPTYVPRPNPLHQYATYTYSIALFILSRQDINLLTENPSEWKPNTGRVKSCLIASGGKNAGQYARNSNFTDDFYFDNLKMTTVIGMNSRSKATNAIDISFTVLEPYGMSLLDRIIEAANDVQAPNFKAMPYLLEIEFYGYDDNGTQILIENQRKRMPVQIIEMKIKVGSKGAEYAIKAIPWNHQALSQSAATTPINLEVKASTVGEFFKNNVEKDQLAVTEQDEAKVAAKSAAQRKESDLKAAEEADRKTRQEESDRNYRAVSEDPGSTPKVSPSARKPEDQTELNRLQGVVNRAFAVASYCGGVNAWYTDLILKKLRGTKDQILFDIHKDIAKTKIVVPEQKDISRSAVRDDKPAAAAEAAGKDANRVFTDAQAFPISAGTSIPAVIDMIMRNSEYVTSQVKDPKNMTPQDLAEKEGKPLNWYKVVPTVKIDEYDFALNKFSTTTTYHIMPYIVYDSKHPQGPTTPPQGAMKQYHYSYTGKNIDILDFSIDFDTLFYTAVTAGAAKWQADIATEAVQQQDRAQKAALESPLFAKELVNRQLRLIPEQPTTGGSGAKADVKQVAATDIQASQYSTSRGDMLNLKLKIVGDPELIKQDDIYTNPSQGGYNTQINTTGIMSDNGSLPMDNGEVMAQVEFRTILDMDDTTGTPAKNPKYEANSVFSGVYRILTVDNLFQGGKFEQTVDLIRMPDVVNNATKTADQGQDNQTSQSMQSADKHTANPDARSPTDGTTSDNRNYYPKDIDANRDPRVVMPVNEDQEEFTTDSLGNTFKNGQLYRAAEVVDESEAEPGYVDLHAVDQNSEAIGIDLFNDQESIDPESVMPNNNFA